MIAFFAKHQRRACTRGGDVFDEVGLIDARPESERHLGRFCIGQPGISVEIRVGTRKGARLELQEPVDIPILDVFGVGIDVDSEIEQVGERQVLTDRGRLKDVEPLDDEDVGAGDNNRVVRNDVVREV